MAAGTAGAGAKEAGFDLLLGHVTNEAEKAARWDAAGYVRAVCDSNPEGLHDYTRKVASIVAEFFGQTETLADFDPEEVLSLTLPIAGIEGFEMRSIWAISDSIKEVKVLAKELRDYGRLSVEDRLFVGRIVDSLEIYSEGLSTRLEAVPENPYSEGDLVQIEGVLSIDSYLRASHLETAMKMLRLRDSGKVELFFPKGIDAIDYGDQENIDYCLTAFEFMQADPRRESIELLIRDHGRDAIEGIILFMNLSEERKNEVYGEVWERAGRPEEAHYGEKHCFDNAEVFLELMNPPLDDWDY